MANISPIKNKSGEIISYQIRVYRGTDQNGKQLKPYSMTWKLPDGWTVKRVEKELNKVATLFEENCRIGNVSTEHKRFDEYAEYVLQDKERAGIKPRTIMAYRQCFTHACDTEHGGIGHLKIQDIRVEHLNRLYTELSKLQSKTAKDRAIFKGSDLKSLFREKKFTQQTLATAAGVSVDTIRICGNGERITLSSAKGISKALGTNLEEIFDIFITSKTLSPKTALECHRFLSTIFEQAVREQIIPFNPASRATPPKVPKHEADVFTIEEVQAILKAADKEPPKWRAIIYLLATTGARRGEICGLRWKSVNPNAGQIYLCNNVVVIPHKGVQDSTLKTGENRYVSLPVAVFAILNDWKRAQTLARLAIGIGWNDGDYVFTKSDGGVINPDSVTSYCDDFAKHYNLPHIHPHKFRHSQASILIEQGLSIIAISKRLGHARTSTTLDIYSHIINKADEKAAEIIDDILLKKA